MNRILRCALALAHTVIEYVRIEGDRVVVGVRPWRKDDLRCPVCGKRCGCYDRSPRPPARSGRWTWPARRAYLEYATRRVACPEHGVLVEAVPWARPRSRFTRDFKDWVAWPGTARIRPAPSRSSHAWSDTRSARSAPTCRPRAARGASRAQGASGSIRPPTRRATST